MVIKEEQKEQIINCGVFDYSAQKLSNILDFDKTEIKIELKNKNSELNKLLKKGKDLADYVIDLKLFNMAKTGDIKALEKLNARKSNRKRIRDEKKERSKL